MPLQKQTVSFPFAQGIDTKTDEKQVVMGKLLELENGVFVKPKKISKRNGYALLPGLAHGVQLMSFKDELLAFDGRDLWSWAPSLMSFQFKSNADNIDIASTPVISNPFAQTIPDSAIHSEGIAAYCWEDARGGIRYSIVDTITHEQSIADSVLDAAGSLPRVFALGNYFIFTYYDGTNIVYKSVLVLNPLTLSNKVNFAVGVVGAAPRYDATVISSRLFLAWNSTAAANAVSVLYLNSFLTLSSQIDVTTFSCGNGVALWGDTDNNVWVAGQQTGLTTVKSFVRKYDLTSVSGVTTTGVIGTIRNIAGAESYHVDSNNNGAVMVVEIAGAPIYNTTTTYISIDRTGASQSVGGSGIMIRSVGIASRIFNYNGFLYMVVAYPSTLQPSYFIVRVPQQSDDATFITDVVGKIASQVAGGVTSKTIVPNVSSINSTDFLIALPVKDTVDVQSGVVFTNTGVDAVTISFASVNSASRAELAQNLHIGGGFLSMYDGIGQVEHGFHVFPETPTFTSSATTGGIGAGTYQWVVVYEWPDNQGNIHRSAPSIPVSNTLAAGTTLNFTGNTTNGSAVVTSVSSISGLFVGQIITGTGIPANTAIQSIDSSTQITMSNKATANGTTVTISTTSTNKMTFTIPTLRLTAKRVGKGRGDVVVAVYRTQNNGTIFYKVSSIASPLANDATVDAVTFNDTVPDFYLNGNELLYTTGGVLENIAPPACTMVTRYRNRIAVVPSENKNQYWLSQDVIPGSPVEFNDSFIKYVSSKDGDVTGLAQLDDKLILFTKNRAMVQVGRGPDATGSQDDIGPPEFIAMSAGCDNFRSIVETPLGIIRHTSKGIYLLDRSLQESYIGAEVEKYNSLTITQALLVPDTNQIRFYTSTGPTLVYDYFFNQWAVFTPQAAQDAAIFQNVACWINSFGQVYQETPGVFNDAGQFIKLRAKTSWLSFAGLQGFQRVYQMLILGDYKSFHELLVKVAYDYLPTQTQIVNIDSGALLENLQYGEAGLYGSDTPYGGSEQVYQFRVFMTRQKCEAIQLEFEEVQILNQLIGLIAATSYGEGLSISALNFLIGVKSGTYKLSNTTERSFS